MLHAGAAASASDPIEESIPELPLEPLLLPEPLPPESPPLPELLAPPSSPPVAASLGLGTSVTPRSAVHAKPDAAVARRQATALASPVFIRIALSASGLRFRSQCVERFPDAPRSNSRASTAL